MHPFCSVIVPVYKAEAYLEKCINSILMQSESDWELILVDDGSPDASGTICDRFAEADMRIRAIHQENQGHTGARNTGLACASGDYVLFVDSDDWIDTTLLADCKAVLIHDPDVVLFGMRRITDGMVTERPQPRAAGFYDREQLEHTIQSEFLIRERFSLSEHLVKRQFMLKYQMAIDSRILLGEDLLCCACFMTAAESAVVLPGCYYNYVQHKGSVAHNTVNYTFENWLYLRDALDHAVGGQLPNYPVQRGSCSVRFLHRAVLGEISRNGIHFQTFRRINAFLSMPQIKEDLEYASPNGKRAYRIKRLCLKHHWSLLLYLIDRASKIF